MADETTVGKPAVSGATASQQKTNREHRERLQELKRARDAEVLRLQRINDLKLQADRDERDRIIATAEVETKKRLQNELASGELTDKQRRDIGAATSRASRRARKKFDAELRARNSLDDRARIARALASKAKKRAFIKKFENGGIDSIKLGELVTAEDRDLYVMAKRYGMKDAKELAFKRDEVRDAALLELKEEEALVEAEWSELERAQRLDDLEKKIKLHGVERKTISGIALHSKLSELDVDKATVNLNELRIPQHISDRRYVVREQFYFDSALASERKSFDLSTMVWDFANKDSIGSSASAIKSRGNIQNVIGLRISAMTFSAFMSDNSFQGRQFQAMYNLQIKEFTDNAYNSVVRGRRMYHHFSVYPKQYFTPFPAYYPDVLDGLVTNDGYFWFSQPLLQMPSTLSFTFFKHNHPVLWPVRRSFISVMTTGNPTILSQSQGGMDYDVGDRVIVFLPTYYREAGFTGELVEFQKLDEENPAFYAWTGHEILIESETDLTIDYDSSGWVGPVPGSVVIVKVEDLSLKFNLEVIYLLEEDRRT
jgi:hypothetical protein